MTKFLKKTTKLLRPLIATSLITIGHTAWAQQLSMDAEIDVETPELTGYDSNSPMTLEEVEVCGSLTTLALTRVSRIITVIGRDEIKAMSATSITDILKLASGIDVRQRGGFGVQSDISLDGGTYDQVSIMLNGVNITSPQTGHYSADWPLSLDDIERIEIIEGAASRYMGASSLMGAINIVTRKPDDTSLAAKVQGGSYGTASAEMRLQYAADNFQHRLSGGYIMSDGGTVNSDFRRGQFYYQGQWESKIANASIQAGYSNMGHGANTFYSGAYPNQYDHLTRYIVSASGAVNTRVRIEPMVYWQRLYDHFQLIRDTSKGENFHYTDVVGGRLNASTNWALGRSTVGTELRKESIWSTTLGKPVDKGQKKAANDSVNYDHHDARTVLSINAEHLMIIDRVSISAGMIAAMNTGYDKRLRIYPGIDASYSPTHQWRFYGSWERSYRMPTFTDLYYKAPTHEGNRDLKPEQIESWQTGAQYMGSGFGIRLNGFIHNGDNMIDWVMYHPEDVFHSTGFDLTNIGFSLNTQVRFSDLLGSRQPLLYLDAGYTYMHQKRHDSQVIYESRAALEYLRHKFTATLSHRLWRNAIATWSVRWQDRMGDFLLYTDGVSQGTLEPYHPYATLDVKINWQCTKALQLTLDITNLTDTHYYDCANIPQPGIWVMGGVTYRLGL